MNNGNGGVPPKPQVTVTINVFPDGKMAVNGFPAEYGQAMTLMQTAQRTVMDFFMAAAVKGEFQEQKIFRPGLGVVPKILKG